MNPNMLGWIRPSDRTEAQLYAHAAADAAMHHLSHFGLPTPQLATGQAVRLFDAWKDPAVVKDVGFAFDRIHQLTGSCVWAGGTNPLVTTIATQRIAGATRTKAFLPFTLHNYAMSRHALGDDSQGEGSLGSTFAASLEQDGYVEWVKGSGLPDWSDADGVSVASESVEMTWSSYRNPALQAVLAQAKTHRLGKAAKLTSFDDIWTAITNGYGCSFACNNYIGKAAVQGSGADACVLGRWDGDGGHQQSIHAVWQHSSLGRLVWAQNNWPGSTYPADPAGGPVCGCWVKEADVNAALKLDSEVYALSHVDWFPAQPDVIAWANLYSWE